MKYITPDDVLDRYKNSESKESFEKRKGASREVASHVTKTIIDARNKAKKEIEKQG